MRRLLGIIAIVVTPTLLAQETRMASDFEIRQMEAQAKKQRDFSGQLSAHLNLGDLRLTRNERSLAMEEYKIAREAAEKERVEARKDSKLGRYATATIYAGLAEAKMGRAQQAFDLLEDGIRFASDEAMLWNVYSSAMTELEMRGKAASAARNAVALGKQPLDIAMYQYALALALSGGPDEPEAISLLGRTVEDLKSNEFEPLRRESARSEAFETYSTVRGEATAYRTVLNRSQLLLATILENRGQISKARAVYEDVLKTRSDDPLALAGLARMSDSADSYAEAFDANPFALDLIYDYQAFLRGASPHTEGTSTGAQMRRALEQIARGENVAAQRTLDALAAKFPNNDAIAKVRKLTAPASTTSSEFLRDLRATLALLAQDRVTPEQRAQLDKTTLTGTAIFNEKPFETGTIDGVPFRFPEPVVFRGEGKFPAKTPLKLTFRILGATELNGASALLLEMSNLEVVK